MKNKTPTHKVIVAGHICLDITPTFQDNKWNNLSEILSPGKLIQMGEANVHTGGAVANTGLAMKILGADVILIGKVGRDAFTYSKELWFRAGNADFGNRFHILFRNSCDPRNRPDISAQFWSQP